jgi:acyl-CoA thioester hydrolase
LAFASCYYGSVNRWECDENDHLNVRFYADKINQSIRVLLGEPAGEPSARWRIVSQHIRFVQEARLAEPLRVDCALLEGAADEPQILSLMHNNITDEPLAGFVSGIGGIDSDQAAVFEGVPMESAVPDWAAPRGVDPANLYPVPGDLAAALALGFRVMGRGVISPMECDGEGRLNPHQVIGRISDGMPNLWGFAEVGAQAPLGGAVVEYRLRLAEPLRAGEAYRQLSGIRAFGNKTQHMVHLVFNETRGVLAASAEAVGVAMDLASRRAVPVSDERRLHMHALMLEAG